MKVLLHTCCGPCAIFPVRELRVDGMTVTGFFYPHNIHPYTECLKRQETLSTFADGVNLPLICETGYDLEGFLRKVVHREDDRCTVCYQERLLASARLAKNGAFDCFTTDFRNTTSSARLASRSAAQWECRFCTGISEPAGGRG
jgi:predicted adenine nucleotide alpha hydrolase (AANH) superfamily ATPase